jgi:RNA polymerase primary sigma factor
MTILFQKNKKRHAGEKRDDRTHPHSRGPQHGSSQRSGSAHSRRQAETATRRPPIAAGSSRVERLAQFDRIQSLPLEYVPSAEFAALTPGSAADRTILGPVPHVEPGRKTTVPSGLPPYIASLYRTPLLTREQEVHLFRKMNYLKYRATEGRARLDPKNPARAAMDQVQRWHDEAVAAKNEIISANLRLVVSIAKRYASSNDTLFDLISDGNMSLVRAVEKFDFARGFRFSTYGTWAIVKNFARSIPTGQRYRSRFHTGQGEAFAAVEDRRSDPRQQETAQADRIHHLSGLLEGLSPREKEIIRYRYGLDGASQPMTLREVGAAMGVTKERVRQLEVRAMRKLREAAGDRDLEPRPDARA